MHCPFGFGGWNQFYLYLLIVAITKVFKEDIIVGDNPIYSFKLEISIHKFMNLFFGYLSEAILGILLFILLKKLKKRSIIKKNLLLSESLESETSTPLDMINDTYNKSNFIGNNLENEKNEEIKSLNLNSTFNSSSYDNEKTQSSHTLRYSLIHTDLLETISENTTKYIIISSFLIVLKEVLIKIIYSTNDIFDYYFVNLIYVTLILKFYFKVRIYRHRLLAVFIATFLSGSCLIGCLFINNYSKEQDKRKLKDLFLGHYYKIVIVILLYIIFSFLFCIGIIIQKNIMENKFISPYKIIIFKGIIGTIVSIIGLIISSLWKCHNIYDKDAIKSIEMVDLQNFKFFVCSVKYNNHNYYYDHFIQYFDSSYNRFKEAMLLILYCFVNFITELCLLFINKFLSPTHYLIAESLYSLIHLPMDYFSGADFDEINKKIKQRQNIDNLNIYQAIVHTLGTRILRFISCFFDFIGYIIYLEIIELKFCGLNKNIKKNIRIRAWSETNDNNSDNSSSDSDEGNEKETKKMEMEAKKEEN